MRIVKEGALRRRICICNSVPWLLQEGHVPAPENDRTAVSIGDRYSRPLIYGKRKLGCREGMTALFAVCR